MTRLQIYLDAHSFGPGKIDGRWGDFVGKALQRFQAANGQQPSEHIDAALREELQKISPVYTTYTLKGDDLHWVGKIPATPGPRNPVGIVGDHFILSEKSGFKESGLSKVGLLLRLPPPPPSDISLWMAWWTAS